MSHVNKTTTNPNSLKETLDQFANSEVGQAVGETINKVTDALNQVVDIFDGEPREKISEFVTLRNIKPKNVFDPKRLEGLIEALTEEVLDGRREIDLDGIDLITDFLERKSLFSKERKFVQSLIDQNGALSDEEKDKFTAQLNAIPDATEPLRINLSKEIGVLGKTQYK